MQNKFNDIQPMSMNQPIIASNSSAFAIIVDTTASSIPERHGLCAGKGPNWSITETSATTIAVSIESRCNLVTSEHADQIMELFEDNAGLRGPPKATLAKRAKSYSNFHEVSVQDLSDVVKIAKVQDPFAGAASSGSTLASSFEDFEEDILDESHEEFQ